MFCESKGPANAQTPDAFAQNQRLGRGVNVLGYDPIWKDRQKARFQEKYFRLIQEAGFNHVRVNLHPFRDGKLGEDDKPSPAWFETLDWAVKHALANRLMVILDFHEFQAMGDDPAGNKGRFLALWRQIAEHCKDAPDDVVFEVLNEPNKKLTPELWNPLLREALAIIRQSNPHRTVIVGPTSWNNIKDLDKLSLPEEDRSLIATVHYYSPFPFTHQGAAFAGLRDKTGVPWDGTEKEQQAVLKDFDTAQSWAEKHHRPIYLGEFGVYDKADMAARVRWTSFVTRQAEKRQWSWAWWQFDGDFVLYDVRRDHWVEPIRRALTPAVVDLNGKPSIRADTPKAFQIAEDAQFVHIETPDLAAAVRKKDYVTGISRQSFLDKKTGFRDPGFGLDIVDWIMEPGSDAAYHDRLAPELIYRNDGEFHLYHGSRPKRSLEGPQICTQAGALQPSIIRGKGFVAVRQQFTYRTAAPGKKTGSVWTQLLVFPAGKRYFISMDKIDAVNSSEAMFLRLDMPGHVRHVKGDTFSEIYLSYRGHIPSAEFLTDFPPDARFDYRRDRDPLPDRFIRGYRLRDPATGKAGPWLLGMTLEPSVVWEAWCHQRGYVCMIEEFGGRPIRPGQSFSAAFVVGYFDTLEEADRVYDAYKGHTALEVSADGWKLTK